MGARQASPRGQQALYAGSTAFCRRRRRVRSPARNYWIATQSERVDEHHQRFRDGREGVVREQTIGSQGALAFVGGCRENGSSKGDRYRH
jgi:hypothetical protein